MSFKILLTLTTRSSSQTVIILTEYFFQVYFFIVHWYIDTESNNHPGSSILKIKSSKSFILLNSCNCPIIMDRRDNRFLRIQHKHLEKAFPISLCHLESVIPAFPVSWQLFPKFPETLMLRKDIHLDLLEVGCSNHHTLYVHSMKSH